MTDRSTSQPGRQPGSLPGSPKSEDAYRTIGEVAGELDLPQHVLRFWETRFPQVKPLKRAGGRRFYRPGDVALLRAVRVLLYDEGYTIKGVQRLLAEHGARHVADALARSRAAKPPAPLAPGPASPSAALPTALSGVAEIFPPEAGTPRDGGGGQTSARPLGWGGSAGRTDAAAPLGAGNEPRHPFLPDPFLPDSSLATPAPGASGMPARDSGGSACGLADRLSLVLAELAECARLLATVRAT